MRVFPSLARSLLALSGLVLLLCLSFVSARSAGGLSRRAHADHRAVLSHDGAVRRAVKKTTSSTSKKSTSTPSKKAVKTTTSSSSKKTTSTSTKKTTSSTSTKKTTTSSSSTKKSSTTSSSTKKTSTTSSTKKISSTSTSIAKVTTPAVAPPVVVVKPTTTTTKTSSSTSSSRTSTSTSTTKTSTSTSSTKTSTSTSSTKTSTSSTSSSKTSSTSTTKTSTSSTSTSTSKTSSSSTSTTKTSTTSTSTSKTSTITSSTSTRTSTTSTSTRATTTTARIALLGKPTAVPLSSGSQLLLQSNLAWSTTPKGYLLMQSGWNQSYAVDACWAYSETLANPPAGDTDLAKQLRYLIYRGVYATGQNFRTANDQTLVITKSDGTYANSTGISTTALLPVLCTQSAPRNTASTTDTSFARRVAVSDGATYVGYRDALSFRFLGVPYANPTDRFEYSTPILNSTGQTYDAYSTSRARQCPQTGVSGVYSENCLLLNIYTPYLPRSGFLVPPIEPIAPNATDSVTTSTAEYTTSTAVIDGQTTTTATTTSAADGTTTTAQPTADPVDPIDGRSYLGSRRSHNQHARRQATARAATSDLRPVMVYFHGGGLTGGTGLDSTFDGGQMVSRGDVLVITVSYRLGTLGWLPFNDGVHNGNYGFADCVTALQWIQKHIATFGGDPNRVTIFGQSAGANQVKRLMISPMAAGLFHRAISQSGSAADDAQALLGLAGAQASAGRVRTSLGCGSATSVPAQLACLRALPASAFVKSGVTVFSRSIVDGTYITKAKSALSGNGGYLNKVPFMLGYMRDERASLGYVPPPTQTNLTAALIAAGVKNTTIAIVLNNTAVFTPNITHGVQNLTVQVQTLDGSTPRCGTKAMAFASVVSGVLDTVYAYVQDQRAWQLPTYDPNNACQTGSRSSMLVTPTQDHSTISDGSTYYFCHSGDVLPTFANAGYQFGLVPRDAFDLIWLRNQIDQWTSFARTGNPNPAAAFISARGYSAVVGDAWPAVSSSATGAMMMSLGPSQRAIPLDSNSAQCDLLGKGLSYILDEGAPSQTQITGNATAMNMGEAIPVVTAEVPAATVSQARRAIPTAPGSGDEDEW